jgi:hypothetical protein
MFFSEISPQQGRNEKNLEITYVPVQFFTVLRQMNVAAILPALAKKHNAQMISTIN